MERIVSLLRDTDHGGFPVISSSEKFLGLITRYSPEYNIKFNQIQQVVENQPIPIPKPPRLFSEELIRIDDTATTTDRKVI